MENNWVDRDWWTLGTCRMLQQP